MTGAPTRLGEAGHSLGNFLLPEGRFFTTG